MRRRWRRSHLSLLIISLLLASCLLITSLAGWLAPAESTVSTPLTYLTGIFNELGQNTSQLIQDYREFQTLQQRNQQLEAAWAAAQAELVQLREIQQDYNRLSELLDYDSAGRNQVAVAAEVIQNFDSNAALRTIVINRGTRDGFSPGMAVVTQNGLVGRIIEVSANASRVLLITDPSSVISGRLENSRAFGGVRGLLTGGLRMQFIESGIEIAEGELVVTSGLGGNLPPNITIGIVTSSRQFEFELDQEAELRSLIDFNRLETVLVITSFEPIDLSVFEDNEDGE